MAAESRKWRAAEIVGTVIGIATVLVALIALLLDHPPFGGEDRADPNPPPRITSGPGTQPTPPTSGSPTTGAGSPQRYLTDLTPDSGGGNVQRVGSHSLRMACGTGDSDDRQRDVSYVMPPAVAYRSFVSGISAAGLRDTRIKAVLLVDQQEIAAQIVPTGSAARLTWSGDRAGQVTLRILCDAGATAATFTDPGLSG